MSSLVLSRFVSSTDVRVSQGLVKLLGVEEDCAVKVDVLTLINIIVNFPMDLSTRVALRGEFVALGITELLAGLEMIDAPALNQQLAIFRDEQSHDQLDENAQKVRLPFGASRLRECPLIRACVAGFAR